MSTAMFFDPKPKLLFSLANAYIIEPFVELVTNGKFGVLETNWLEVEIYPVQEGGWLNLFLDINFIGLASVAVMAIILLLSTPALLWLLMFIILIDIYENISQNISNLLLVL